MGCDSSQPLPGPGSLGTLCPPAPPRSVWAPGVGLGALGARRPHGSSAPHSLEAKAGDPPLTPSQPWWGLHLRVTLAHTCSSVCTESMEGHHLWLYKQVQGPKGQACEASARGKKEEQEFLARVATYEPWTPGCSHLTTFILWLHRGSAGSEPFQMVV